MRKSVQYLALWVYSLLRWPLNRRLNRNLKGRYITAQALINFIDPSFPNKTFGVVMFVLPPGTSLDNNFVKDLYGSFGFTTQVDLLGKHLYGRDTWGEPSQEMVEENPEIKSLVEENPSSRIQLAGVRRFFGRHIWPLNNPSQYRLYSKEVEMPHGTLMWEFFGRTGKFDWKAAGAHTLILFSVWAILTELLARMVRGVNKLAYLFTVTVSGLLALAHVIQWVFVPNEKAVNGKMKIFPVITVFSSLLAVMVEWIQESAFHKFS